MSHCAFYGTSEGYREFEWASQVPKSAVCYDRHTVETFRVFTLTVFFYQSTMDSKFPENCYHSGNTAHGGATLHMIKSMVIW